MSRYTESGQRFYELAKRVTKEQYRDRVWDTFLNACAECIAKETVDPQHFFIQFKTILADGTIFTWKNDLVNALISPEEFNATYSQRQINKFGEEYSPSNDQQEEVKRTIRSVITDNDMFRAIWSQNQQMTEMDFRIALSKYFRYIYLHLKGIDRQTGTTGKNKFTKKVVKDGQGQLIVCPAMILSAHIFEIVADAVDNDIFWQKIRETLVLPTNDTFWLQFAHSLNTATSIDAIRDNPFIATAIANRNMPTDNVLFIEQNVREVVKGILVKHKLHQFDVGPALLAEEKFVLDTFIFNGDVDRRAWLESIIEADFHLTIPEESEVAIYLGLRRIWPEIDWKLGGELGNQVRLKLTIS